MRGAAKYLFVSLIVVVVGAFVAVAGSLAALPSEDAPEVAPMASIAEIPSTPAFAPGAPAASTPARAAVTPALIAAPPVPEERDAFAHWSPTVATLPRDLGDMGPSLKLGLDEVRNNDMAFCFRNMGPGGMWSTRATDFVLYLETRDGAVDVVDARVARPGALPESVVECCREVLRGVEVKVFFSVPGQRFSYIYEIEA